ncbi:MAG: Hpt domain-containing protein [Alphaproteobacteria bacterium]
MSNTCPANAGRAWPRAGDVGSLQQPVRALEQLRSSISDEDWKQVAHFLKGSARTIGAWHMAQAERAEVLQRDGLVPFRCALIDEIEASLREAETCIAALLKDR